MKHKQENELIAEAYEEVLNEQKEVTRWIRVTFKDGGSSYKDISWADTTFDEIIRSSDVGSADNRNAPYDIHTYGQQRKITGVGMKQTTLYAERGKGVEINFAEHDDDHLGGMGAFGSAHYPGEHSLAFYSSHYLAVPGNADFSDPKVRKQTEIQIDDKSGDLRPYRS